MRHPDVSKQADAWCQDVESSSWETPHDVKKRFGSADFPGGKNAIFNLKGNRYRVLTKIDYTRGIVVIVKAGTHEEYNSWRIK